MDPSGVALLGRLIEIFRNAEARFGRAIVVALIVGAAVWVMVIHLVVPVLPFDDAYITFRYAENIVAGKGPVYNQGERVFGTSTPVYLAWLTGLRFLVSAIPLPDLAVRLNSLWMIVAGVLSYLLVFRLSESRLLGGLAAITIMLHRSMLPISSGGMESFLFVSLLLASWLALTTDRPVLFGLLAGLAVLTRPEGVVLVPLAVMVFWRRRNRLVRAGVACGAIVLVWMVFATAYYGSPIPNSVVAKSQPLYPIPPGTSAKVVVTGVAGMLVDDYEATRKAPMILLVWGIWGMAAIASGLDPEARRRGTWLPACFMVGVLGLYLVGNPAPFLWYWPHLFVPALVALIVGIPVLGRWIHRRVVREHTSATNIAAPVAGGLVLLICLVSLVKPYVGAPSGMWSALTDVSENSERLRVLAYRRMAEELNKVTDETTRIAAPEIGSLGYYFKGLLLDGCGLVSPEVIPFLPVPIEQRFTAMTGAISLEMVQATNPEWIATMPIFAKKSLFPSAWFKESYEVVGSVPLPKEIWTSKEIVILKRKTTAGP